ncbi:PDDEXK nuclease domain-containing protein [uncultured Algoriphagus sp.]|uniref:PDDEXK nuclease domain-containing protein n=1 Tax=uncultured Algoriphagus sp. TaxID=417365 RepID=UPI0030EB55A9|tara:strand:- start:467 stop:1528 length:1062 start_codon:yes stop_codon:yes gene_type:complete
MDIQSNQEYQDWLKALKAKVSVARVKAALAANKELIHFYFDLGRMISEQQMKGAWGDKLLEQLSKDLASAFPEMKGFSVTNLKYCRHFYHFYQSEVSQQTVDQLTVLDFGQHIVDQLPWGHNVLIFTKSKSIAEAIFYQQQTLHNNWSRDTLGLQLKTNLYERNGKIISNFEHTLPKPTADLAQQSLKDPYVFDFVALAKTYNERDIETQLVKHISKFLLELGKGFAYIGRQYHLQIADKDYYIDLLFYHVVLKAYVVIELKNTAFIPEYAGKLNFYLSAVDSLLKADGDKPTIGILLCRDKNNIEAEFALRDINKPMGVSEFQLTEVLPENLKSSLPTIEEIEQTLKQSSNE